MSTYTIWYLKKSVQKETFIFKRGLQQSAQFMNRNWLCPDSILTRLNQSESEYYCILILLHQEKKALSFICLNKTNQRQVKRFWNASKQIIQFIIFTKVSLIKLVSHYLIRKILVIRLIPFFKRVQLVFIKPRANCISLEVLANLIRRKRFSWICIKFNCQT